MATAVQVESLWNGLTDNSGQPLAAGRVFTYAAGTTTPVSLFTASDKSTSATNPLILDANGKAQVWADGRYKFVIKTAADVTLYTLDNLLYGFDDTTVLYGGVSTGAANAQVVSVPATVTSYANGQTVSFVAGFTNTGATTLQFNSLSAINLVKGPTPSSLQAGDLIAGQLYTATYHGGALRLQDYPSVADVQRSRYELATSVAGTNTITANLTPAPSSYETGMVVQLVAAANNTGAATLNLNGLGARTVQKLGSALTGGELIAGQAVQLFYDGTNFHILSSNVGSGTVGAPSYSFGADSNTGIFAPAADTLAVATGGVERTRVDSTGRFGIGTTSPRTRTHITGTTPATGNYATNPGTLQIDEKGITNLTTNGGLEFQTSDAGAGYGCKIVGYDNGSLIVGVRSNSATFTEAFRVQSDGLVGINATPSSAQFVVVSGGTARAALQTRGISGDVAEPSIDIIKFDNNNTTTQNFVEFYINNGGTGSGKITANGASAAAFGTFSDERLKENIVDLPSQLANILALRPIEFDYKNGSGHQIGFIAQEVQQVYPDLVGQDGEYLTLSDMSKNDARLIKAFQELAAKVESLEARLAVLEAV